jgi:hypothetical protein
MIVRYLARPDYPEAPAHIFAGLDGLSLCGAAARHDCKKPEQSRSHCQHCRRELAKRAEAVSA